MVNNKMANAKKSGKGSNMVARKAPDKDESILKFDCSRFKPYFN